MKRRAWHRTRVLLMALLLGVGMSLSLVQASAMAAKMAVTRVMAAPGSGGCDGCGDDDPDGVDLVSCLAACGAALHGLLPGEPADLPRASRTGFHTTRPVFHGRTNTPDHGPPKILPPR
jgi:hypothetical protein